MTLPTLSKHESSSPPRCLKLHADDNVAVVLQPVTPGPVSIIGSTQNAAIVACESIASGHKITLQPIGECEAVLKYGVSIGLATQPIEIGAWVHTHNCRSRLDERSHTLDRHTGAPTDIHYV